jgi:branched-subunit amino acid transport protein
VLACGAVTFLLRVLPIRFWKPGAGRANSRYKPLLGILQAIGPAAITALLVVSLWPARGTPVQAHTLLAIVLGLAVVAGAKKMIGGIAFPALFGAIAYGLCLQWG